ncbi:MAG: hypothetical protein LBT59_16525 [Clostridiales bacterium]|jgi:serine/threonine-protein kinase|nr:hypothetical protein [Clostridiales bacterium]
MQNSCIQNIDGVSLKLKAPFDFGFICRYGRVFKVFDAQDSGNICFGVTADNGKRYFVKFAGAPTAEYDGIVADAVERLKATVPVYMDLAHLMLIRFVKAEEAGGGYAIVFDWIDAICALGMYPEDYKAFRRLPLETMRHIFADILEFQRVLPSADM